MRGQSDIACLRATFRWLFGVEADNKTPGGCGASADATERSEGRRRARDPAGRSYFLGFAARAFRVEAASKRRCASPPQGEGCGPTTLRVGCVASFACRLYQRLTPARVVPSKLIGWSAQRHRVSRPARRHEHRRVSEPAGGGGWPERPEVAENNARPNRGVEAASKKCSASTSQKWAGRSPRQRRPASSPRRLRPTNGVEAAPQNNTRRMEPVDIL